jgi:hypothetical protein
LKKKLSWNSFQIFCEEGADAVLGEKLVLIIEGKNCH